MTVAGARLSLPPGAAIVTGGASGLGGATTERLHSEGMRILVCDIDEGAGAAMVERLGDGVEFTPVDVTDSEALASAAERAAAMHPEGLRVAVGCAGIAPPERLFKDGRSHDPGRFRAVLEVNLVGAFNLLRGASRAMAMNKPADGERGVCVLTASVAAYDGQVGQVAYAAAKAGIVGMTLPAARDLADIGVRVCSLAPGTFDTPLLAGLPSAAREGLAAGVPFPRRLGDPAEFADMVASLVRNEMMNGETVRLDGALRMAPR